MLFAEFACCGFRMVLFAYILGDLIMLVVCYYCWWVWIVVIIACCGLVGLFLCGN